MKNTGNLLVRALNLGLLAGAWLVVPGGERTEWWREWSAELWQARREHECDGRVSWASERTLINFCLGAYQDALCLRRLESSDTPRTSRALWGRLAMHYGAGGIAGSELYADACTSRRTRQTELVPGDRHDQDWC